MCSAVPNCLQLLRQVVWRAESRAWAKTGNRIAAKMAMMAMTTRSSMRVKPHRARSGPDRVNVSLLPGHAGGAEAPRATGPACVLEAPFDAPRLKSFAGVTVRI